MRCTHFTARVSIRYDDGCVEAMGVYRRCDATYTSAAAENGERGRVGWNGPVLDVEGQLLFMVYSERPTDTGHRLEATAMVVSARNTIVLSKEAGTMTDLALFLFQMS